MRHHEDNKGMRKISLAQRLLNRTQKAVGRGLDLLHPLLRLVFSLALGWVAIALLRSMVDF